MGLNKFIDSGTDEAILKSLTDDIHVDQEELQKAMNKSGLVQVQTTVNGKNGTYTRMQWKKASDVKSTDKVVGQKDNDNDNDNDNTKLVMKLENGEHSVHIISGSLEDSSYTVKDDEKGFVYKIKGNKVFAKHDLDKPIGTISKQKKEMSLVDVRNTPEGRKIIDDLEEAENEIKDREIDPKDTSEVYVNIRNENIKKLKDKFGYNWVDTQDIDKKPSKSSGPAYGNYVDKRVKELSEKSTSTKLSKEDAKKKTQSFTSKVGKTSTERSEFMSKVKAQGITWKESDKDGINWMRACMAMNSHFANGGSFDDKFEPHKQKKPSVSKPRNKKAVNISTDKYDISYFQYAKDNAGNMTYEIHVNDKNGDNVFRTYGRPWNVIKQHINRYI